MSNRRKPRNLNAARYLGPATTGPGRRGARRAILRRQWVTELAEKWAARR